MIGALLCLLGHDASAEAQEGRVSDSSPLCRKAQYLERDVLSKHWLEGLYVSLVPASPIEAQHPHTINEPGNVIHAGVWTGRLLGGIRSRLS